MDYTKYFYVDDDLLVYSGPIPTNVEQAMEMSIAKWRVVSENAGILDGGTKTCQLCTMFWKFANNGCPGCPIVEYGEDGNMDFNICYGTWYAQYYETREKEFADKELAFLKKVRSWWNLRNIKRGTQIIYVPMHAGDDVDHPDCETGFVTSVKGEVVYCRYWSKVNPGELRTKLNSEGTPIDSIVAIDTVSQHEVDAALKEILGG